MWNLRNELAHIILKNEHKETTQRMKTEKKKKKREEKKNNQSNAENEWTEVTLYYIYFKNNYK